MSLQVDTAYRVLMILYQVEVEMLMIGTDLTSPAVFVDMVHCLIETAHYLKTHPEISILCAHVFNTLTNQTERYCSLTTACTKVADCTFI